MTIEIAELRKKITRRMALGGFGAMAAIPALAEECRIGPPEHEKGPLVWMDMDQVELDAAYDQSFYAPLIRQDIARWASNSESVRTRLGMPQRESYGPTEVARHLSHQTPECSDLRLHSRRCLVRRRSKELRISGRAVRQRRRALRCA